MNTTGITYVIQAGKAVAVQDPKVGKLQEIANILAAEFNIKPPLVSINSRRRGASYTPMFRRINIPFAGSWRGTENSMVHEFAHHLVNVRSPRARPHGSEFIRALAEVSAAWYGDIHQYDWKTEYKSVKSWYEKKVRTECKTF